MSLKEDLNELEMLSESSDSSEGASDDGVSTGSTVQPPDLATGYCYVAESRCRASYRKHRSDPKAPYLICLGRADCRRRYGGQHPVLRTESRAEAGLYKGVYDSNGKLLAAKSGTRTTPATLATSQAKLAAEKLASDRAQASMIGGLSDDVSLPSLKDPSRGSDRDQGGVQRADGFPLSISDAEDLLAPASDQTVGNKNSGSVLDLSGQNTALLKLMSSLCQKIEDLGTGIEKGNSTIIQALGESKTTPPTKPSALRAASFNNDDERAAIASTARKHATAARIEGTRKDKEEEELANDRSDDDDGWPYNDPDWGPYDPTKKPRTKKSSRKKFSSRSRLYAIAKGKGGLQTIGLYREEWDTIEFLVHVSGSRYKKVRSENEGIAFIKSFLRKKKLPKPKWMKEGTVHYPRVAALRRQFEMSDSSDSSSEGSSSSESDSSAEEQPKKNARTAEVKAGVDGSMGRDNELFGVDVKSVTVLERGIAPKNLGKHTISLLLE